MNTGLSFLNCFQRIYIINLEDRHDRKNEAILQLTSIGMDCNNEKIQFYKAIRPHDAGEFESVGAKGCFLSHLAVLKDAKQRNLDRVLIFEDDINFSRNFNIKGPQLVIELAEKNWDIFYGDCRNHHLMGFDQSINLSQLQPQMVLEMAHFVAFQGNTISKVIDFLEQALERKSGDVEGGPMHVDGAYNFYRLKNPECRTYISHFSLGYQRSSRSDIAYLQWYDRLNITRKFSSLLRNLLSLFQAKL